MANILPSTPGALSIEPELITARNNLVPAFGGPEQRRNRMGSRYALKVRLEPMIYEDAQDWADLDDETDTCVWTIPQPDLDIGAPGTPLVAGADQAGANLDLDGLTPHYVFRKNQWITVITDGQRYCYRVRSETIAGADGTVTVPLRTMLRVPPADNDTVEVAQPKIEGFVTVDEGAWRIDGEDRLIRLSFTIKERE